MYSTQLTFEMTYQDSETNLRQAIILTVALTLVAHAKI